MREWARRACEPSDRLAISLWFSRASSGGKLSVREGFRVVSSYPVGDRGERIWIITEADRSSTCILLPEEY